MITYKALTYNTCLFLMCDICSVCLHCAGSALDLKLTTEPILGTAVFLSHCESISCTFLTFSSLAVLHTTFL